MVLYKTSTKSGVALGQNAGHKVELLQKAKKQANRKGALNATVAQTKSIIREVVGFTPYEKRIAELLKAGGVNGEKRARRFAKKRLGTLKRAQRKVAEIQALIDQGAL
mmetsp:Transcript_249/g.840  ORF Transcript_249/g.840 Transcript_249/m.840 type:complete len:108 (+) Transcript_249:50-373(+)